MEAGSRGWNRLAGLHLQLDGLALEAREQQVAAGFQRGTTVVFLRGNGLEGSGEDVSFGRKERTAFRSFAPALDLAGRGSLREFCRRLDACDLSPGSPRRAAVRRYRRWAFESAALDLALRQAGLSLPEALERTLAPLRFCRSMSLGHPPEAGRMLAWRRFHPELEFKLDAGPDWTPALAAALHATGAVIVVDLKGHYGGRAGGAAPSPELHALVAEGLPGAWIEDPCFTPETEAVLRAHAARISWDAPIGSVAGIEALPLVPRALNLKPSRFGSLRRLFAAYEWCERHDVAAYGGGQYELGPGRGQAQMLAALFHPQGPNDLAPAGWNTGPPRPGLPASPLKPGLPAPGFRWCGDGAP